MQVEKMVKTLETLQSELNESAGRQQILERQLKEEFGISINGIKKLIAKLKKERDIAETKAKSKLKAFRKAWKEYFEDEPCPI